MLYLKPVCPLAVKISPRTQFVLCVHVLQNVSIGFSTVVSRGNLGWKAFLCDRRDRLPANSGKSSGRSTDPIGPFPSDAPGIDQMFASSSSFRKRRRRMQQVRAVNRWPPRKFVNYQIGISGRVNVWKGFCSWTLGVSFVLRHTFNDVRTYYDVFES